MTRIHLIGIGGTGLSAIAHILIAMGYTVSGSDRAESPIIRDLQSAGAVIHLGHQPEYVCGADLVVRSSAIPDDNPEVAAARLLGIPVLKRSDFVGNLMEGKTCIAIAGTHGKTTTASMIAWSLYAQGQDPSFIVGGILANLSVNAKIGKSNLFVIEADEYDRMFLGLRPTIEVVTNIEYDHPDCYPTQADFQAAFEEFMLHLPAGGTLVACVEDFGARVLMDKAEKLGKAVIPYGLSPRTEAGKPLDVYASMLAPNEIGGFSFCASVLGNQAMVNLQIPGKHNVRNALGALTVTRLLDLPLCDAAQALGQFSGNRRRFEVRGEVNDIVIVDDYAHHPTEIQATLAAARARYPSHRIWAVWQPHTYSRTQALFKEFTSSFSDADEVIVTEIYAARESGQGFSSKQVVEAMSRPAHFIAGIPEVSGYLIKNLHPGDILLVLSAGDADQISTEVLTHLKNAMAEETHVFNKD